MAPEIDLKATTGLPHEAYSVSYWLAHNTPGALTGLNADAPLPSSPTDPVDAVVVGSGITGAFAAYNLTKELGNEGKVVLLEAREVCSGATGRNGGHLRPDRFAGFSGYASIVGEEQAHRVLENEVETLAYVQQVIAEEKIECDLWVGETLAVFLTEAMKVGAKKSWDAYKAYGKLDEQEVHFIDNPEVAKKVSRTKTALALAKWPAASLYPHKLVSSLLRICIKRGLRLYTHAPVTSVAKTGDLWAVVTKRPTGIETVYSKTVLLATNAYTAFLRPEFQQHIFPIQEWCSALAPSDNFTVPEVAEPGPTPTGVRSPVLAKGPLQYTMCLFTDDHAFEYLVPRQAGTDQAWILGGGQESMTAEQLATSSVNDSNGATGVQAYGTNKVMAKKMRDYFAAYPDRQFINWGNKEDSLERLWTGIIGMSRDTLPYVGQLEPGLFACVGFHGHGMARTATCGRGIAKLLLASLRGADAELKASNEEWESLSGLPACFRWTAARQARRDINYSVYQP